MQTLGIGVDIIENSRIKKSIINKNFINRVFSVEEITESKKMKNKVSFFSKTEKISDLVCVIYFPALNTKPFAINF